MDKNIYIVKESDLIGDIKDFPIEVVQKMVERQYAQNGYCNVTVFQNDKCSGGRGFCWGPTPEGDYFWRSIIERGNYGLFFDKYPKFTHKCVFTVVDDADKYKKDVKAMLLLSTSKTKFAYENKVGDIYYIDQDRHGDRRVRFALANSALAKSLMEKGVKFSDAVKAANAEQKSDEARKSKDVTTNYSFTYAIRRYL